MNRLILESLILILQVLRMGATMDKATAAALDQQMDMLRAALRAWEPPPDEGPNR